MGGARALALTVAAGTVLSLLAPAALAETPSERARAAIERTAAARTARSAVSHRFVAADRSLEQRVRGTLAGGDYDLVSDGEGGTTRRVAVGTTVYERRPDQPGSPWRTTTRPAPSGGGAFGTLALADGTHVGDPKLYRSATSAGTEPLPQGAAEKLVLELDMSAVASAMRLSGVDAERLVRMQGTLTLWVSADGRVARNALRLVIPSGAGPTTLETTVELADLDSPITITPPAGP